MNTKEKLIGALMHLLFLVAFINGMKRLKGE